MSLFMRKSAHSNKKRSKKKSRVGVKASGQLKKGFRFAKGGRVVKAKKKR